MKQHVVDNGKTLLVIGPASVKVLSGNVEVLGALAQTKGKIVIREGKQMAFEVKKKATFSITLGEGGTLEEVNGSTLPDSWSKAVEQLLSEDEKPVKIVVIGKVDVGKTSFCTYLVNKALQNQQKVAVIDGDLGQSDIGPPSTIGYAPLNSLIRDLFEVEMKHAFFVGTTSTSGATDRVINGLNMLENKAQESTVDLLIINTDGWVEGEDAVDYKVQLVESVSAEVVVGIEEKDELAPIFNSLKTLKGVQVFSASSPSAVKKRSPEKRKVLREMGYKKHLRKAKTRSLPMSWVKIKGAMFGGTNPPSKERRRKIEKMLDANPLYCEEGTDFMVLVLRRGMWVDETRILSLEKEFKKRVKVFWEGDEEGLLVGLHDVNDVFLGIGILRNVDFVREELKIFTPVEGEVSMIRFGEVRLNERGDEVGKYQFFA
jgi:polynucleotide 5'-hydroxyl-kinase GRC3/NOL9